MAKSKTFTATVDGQTFTRTSKTKTYTHVVAMRCDGTGYESAGHIELNWASSRELALKAAETMRRYKIAGATFEVLAVDAEGGR